MIAELEIPPARSLFGELAVALGEADRAFRGLASADAAPPVTIFLDHLIDLRDQLATKGYPVQAEHIADAVSVLSQPDLPGLGEYDEETLEREAWAVLDRAHAHIAAAMVADTWRSIGPVAVRAVPVTLGRAA